MAGDTADSLAARVLQLEHQIYPFCFTRIGKKTIVLIAGRCALAHAVKRLG